MLRFVTGNEGKVREAETYLTEPLAQADFDYTEIQSDSLAEIALHGAREAFDHLDGDDPIIVDDSGLFIDALGGFPGPYSAYVEDTVGVERVWNLTEMEDNRRARFRSVVAYYDGERAETFEGAFVGASSRPAVRVALATTQSSSTTGRRSRRWTWRRKTRLATAGGRWRSSPSGSAPTASGIRAFRNRRERRGLPAPVYARGSRSGPGYSPPPTTS